ncbi:hypothetical protein [Anaerocolumna sp. MB42-C2]|uniref:hypothetical protein n=1 Tax=Anaerocolumna sp. MB42-C2 TaxID=3070997 RepID=UPI0027DFBA9D|nr:hypothetical protein [Anaerocolumna sp. MB42-C2]WMJ86746.1 hypothetical protein RBU59_22305 [Anaerocolumna sp. MB42-C2]
MNQVIEGIIQKDKMLAEEKYNKKVNYNLKHLKDDEDEDPDKSTLYKCDVDGLTIYLAQDGLCGLKELKVHSENIESDYKLIREGMFDCLVWPAYAMSINQMRYAKYRDRLDLTLIDIQRFYIFVKPDTELTLEITANIFKECELGRSYVFPHTFYWLRSFKNFNDFIKDRNLGAFVDKDENDQFIAKEWINTESSEKGYFKELLRRVENYKTHKFNFIEV